MTIHARNALAIVVAAAMLGGFTPALPVTTRRFNGSLR